MIVETGHFALVLALALALCQRNSPAMGRRDGDSRLMGLRRPSRLRGLGLSPCPISR